MKKSKLSYFLLILLLVMTTALMSVALVACNKKPKPAQTGPEAGAYYYDAGNDEYTVVLGEGTQFTLSIAGMTRAGSYTLKDSVLTLTSNKKDENQITAVLNDDVIVLTYEEAEYRFLKKINYTVTFDSKEGSNVKSATVVNGKKVQKPNDPTRDGFIFVGWYEDDEFNKPFLFNSRMITENTTVFARWVEKQVGGVEFVAQFNANNGADNPSAQTTVGGKLFNLPEVEREGYEFKGWWVSMTGDNKLSYEATDGMTLQADETLHALWQAKDLGAKLAEPLVNVDATSIRWNSLGTGAKEYLLQVQSPDGNYIVNKTMGVTVESIDFNSLPAGDYTIKVTAVAMSGDENNSVVTRVYKNKGIARVSRFSVIEPSVLLFNAVDNAEKYLITVDCGDKNHNHVKFDNGLSTQFNFADCMMQNSGIKFTVTAIADGYASSTSQQFVYAPVLGAVTEFSLDDSTQKLVWNEVKNASGYMVSVKCGNTAHSEEFVNVGTVNSISLKECAKCEGGIVVKVYPISQMYISPEAATYTFDKQNLATPQNIRIKGTTVSWDAVAGATSYEVNIAGRVVSSTTTSVDIKGVDLVEKQNYTLTVVAKGDKDSLATDPIDARNLAMADSIKYENSVLSWKHVIGAVSYQVQVNDEAVFSVSNGSNFAEIELTQAGINTLKVRFIGETGTAFEWVSTSVFAHTLTFVSDGGSRVDEQYKAVGDSIKLPAPSKQGYDFLAWYNTSKGPESNGAAYKDSTFNEVGDLMLYACYTPKEYKVTYNYGTGGNGAEVNGSVFYQKDYQLAVPEANEATSAFGGWFSAPNGNGVQYTDDKGNSLKPWNRADNVEVYAFWFDDVLSFELTTVSGKQVYEVKKGSRISQVSEITIPEMYKGVKVGMISGNAFLGCSNLTAINIPNSIERISATDAFTGCSSLEAINVYDAENTGYIRYWSSDGVLFDNGDSSAQTKAQISVMPLGKTGSYTIPYGIETIPMNAFANSSLSRVVIPASVTVIAKEAFVDSKQLTTIVFDTGSTAALTIADGAFKNCEALVSVSLPARLASIDLNKYELGSATGSPATQEVLTTGVSNAFVGCKNLENIYIASGNKAYKCEDGIIYDANKTTLLYAVSTVSGDIVIPEGVTKIADGAFIGCGSISSVTIPSSTTSIGECAFYSTGVRSVTFKGVGFNDVTIGKYAFRNCGYLSSVVFDENNRVAHIGEGAFAACGSLYNITLPVNLKSVGAQAFRECDELEEVIIASTSSDLTFGADVFYECESLTTVNLPKNVSKLPGIFSGCESLERVTVDPDNPYFETEYDVLYTKGKTTILFYPQSKSDSSYVSPDTLVTISDGVFRGNRYLESVTIGKNVEYIGSDAFRECDYLSEVIFATGDNGAASLEIGAYAFYYSESIEEIVLPARTTKVGAYAFAEMTGLSSITLNEGLKALSDHMLYNAASLNELHIPASVETIGTYALCYDDTGWYASNRPLDVTFAAQSKLKTIEEYAFATADYSGKISITSIVLPEGLEKIGYRAFYESALEEIVIPKSVTIIEAEAFLAKSYSSNTRLATVKFVDGGTKDLLLGAQYTDKYGTIYEGNVFGYCSYITEIALPARTVFIGSGTFADSGLTSVTFGENSRLKHIGEKAFSYTDISSLTIPKSVSNGNVKVDAKGTEEFRIGIGKCAFYAIHTLEVINFEDGGTEPLSLGDGAFNYMNKLTTLNLPSRLADYTLADGKTVVRGISDAAFASVDNSGNAADGQNSSSKLANINIGEGGAYCSVNGVVYTADKKVLVLCPAGKTDNITVDAKVEKIEDKAFMNTNISGITFKGQDGDADMVIGRKAFYGCNSLTEVVLSDNVADVLDEAFGSCATLKKFTLSAKMTTYNPSIFNYTNLTTIIVSTNNKDLTAVEGVMFSADKKTLISYPATNTKTTYTVPNSVTVIAENAFKNSKNLTQIVLPSGLKEIGKYAFSGCSNLSEVTIPNTVEMIDERAFDGCGITSLKFEKNGTVALVIGNQAFGNPTMSAVELPARLTALGANAFYYNNSRTPSKLTNVTFESGSKLDSIGDSAFYGNSMETVALPQSLKIMGNKVFGKCANLVTVTFGEGLISIGDYTFTKCPALEGIAFPASLTTMGIGTFTDNDGYSPVYCSALKSVTFAQGSLLETIPEGTFYNCTALERFVIPASVTKIDTPLWDDEHIRPENAHYGAFQNCTSLRSVTFEEGTKCKEVGSYAFRGCAKLEAFAIPTSVSYLGVEAFYGCESIEEIVIPATAAVYGRGLFYNCSSLVRVTLNEKATALADYMFAGCTSLKQLNIPSSVTNFGQGLFYGAGIETFVVPSYVNDLPLSFFSGCKSLVSVQLPSGLKTIGGQAFSGCTALTSIEIPSGVYSIGDGAFQNCDALTEVELPAALETIGSSAFAHCIRFTSITIPSKVMEIGNGAFNECYKLVEVYNLSNFQIGGRNDNSYIKYYAEEILQAGDDSIITTINGFQLFVKGTTVKVLGYVGNETAITLPSNATAIYEYAFVGSNIVSVTIPAGVTQIADYAFYNCSNLTTVVMQGQVTTIGQYAFADCARLATINLPDSINSIGKAAFENCVSIKDIVNLPTSLSSLGYYAFRGCVNLKNIVLPEGLTSLGDYAFANCTSLVSVKLPTTLTDMWHSFDNCSALERYIMDGDGKKYCVRNGALCEISSSKVKLISIPAGKKGTFVVSNDIQEIGDDAFVGSNLDLLKFEARSKKLDPYSWGYSAWLRKATVKAVVISKDAFESLYADTFESWTSEQTVYFVESEEDAFSIKNTNANVVYNYQENQQGA